MRSDCIVPLTMKAMLSNSELFHFILGHLNPSLRIGIDKKAYFRISNVERTLLEAMKFSTKIGQRTVISSVRKALKERLTTEKKLAQMSSRLKMKNVLQKYWEAIVV